MKKIAISINFIRIVFLTSEHCLKKQCFHCQIKFLTRKRLLLLLVVLQQQLITKLKHWIKLFSENTFYSVEFRYETETENLLIKTFISQISLGGHSYIMSRMVKFTFCTSDVRRKLWPQICENRRGLWSQTCDVIYARSPFWILRI